MDLILSDVVIMKIGVVSTGHTKFGKTDMSIGDLMFDVCKQTLDNANISLNMVDVIYISNFSRQFY